ncbi:MAG: hypothetical protein LUQ22_05280 [Methanotrichaceae archaeon]|nr:hypothetical protein [Methanotrichaceae archaeon]
MIESSKKCLVVPRVAPDDVNPRMLELEVAKEILSELFGIRTHEVEEMIRRSDRRADALRSGVQSIHCLKLSRFLDVDRVDQARGAFFPRKGRHDSNHRSHAIVCGIIVQGISNHRNGCTGAYHKTCITWFIFY